MILLTRKERVRTLLFLKVMASGVLGGAFGWSPLRRFAYALYSYEVLAPMIYVPLLFTARFDAGLLAAGLLVGTCVLTWHGVMIYLHRYLSHRSFRIRWRPLESLLGLLATLSLQGYPLTWAFFHRRHHQAADTERDPHSPLHSSAMWLFSLFKLEYKAYVSEAEYEQYRAAFPERLEGVSHTEYLARLDRYAVRSALFQLAFFSLLMVVGGWSWVVYFQLLPAVVVHTEVCLFINVLSHHYGYRNFELKSDRATNHFSAGLTISEWQNNHHRFPACASNRVRFWELDVLYLILLAWRKLGWVSDLVLRVDASAERVAADQAS